MFFPGSTIGNFDPPAASAFLRRMARVAARDGRILIGVDLKKDRARLEAAYDDAAGVTAAFNLNLLDRMRRELDAVIPAGAFRHEARYNAVAGRVEMHLVADAPTAIEVDGQRFVFEAGESIHTENSYKYDAEGFARLADDAGLEVARRWSDPEQLFGVLLLQPRS